MHRYILDLIDRFGGRYTVAEYVLAIAMCTLEW